MEPGVNEAEWRRWVAEHAPKLLLFARQKARCEADAQDLVQEALVESYKVAGRHPPALPAVFGKIRLRAIDLARRNGRRATREQNVVELVEPWFDPAPEDREMKAILENALRRLPDIYQEVVTLKIWGELTFSDIGEALEISPNTAASRYRYALEELRRITKGVFA